MQNITTLSTTACAHSCRVLHHVFYYNHMALCILERRTILAFIITLPYTMDVPHCTMQRSFMRIVSRGVPHRYAAQQLTSEVLICAMLTRSVHRTTVDSAVANHPIGRRTGLNCEVLPSFYISICVCEILILGSPLLDGAVSVHKT